MQRLLGNTGLRVTRLGLGLAALGRPGYINLGHADDLNHCYDIVAMQQRTHEVLDEAWKCGVRYFDAARSYGRAEEFLSSWIRSRGIANDVVVGSKWGYTYTAGWQTQAEKHEVKDHSLPVLLRQHQESVSLLGKSLRLYQVHSATLESGLLTDVAVLEHLAHLRSSGLKIGLSLSGPRQADTLRRALEVVVAGTRLFDCVQATWNLLEPSVGPALQEAHRAGLGVIVKEALANGRLTARNTDPSFRDKLRLMMETATTLHTTPDALALAVVLSQPWVDVVLSGASTTGQLHDNLQSLPVTCSPEILDRLTALQESPEGYWTRRARLEWN